MSRVIRYKAGSQPPRWGLLNAGETVSPLVGSPFEGLQIAGDSVPLVGVQFMAPVLPSKVVGVGSNYRAHVQEMGRALPQVPKIFLMPPSAVVGPGESINIPPGTQRVDHEAELGLVIGKRMTRVSPEDCMSYVFGYTVVNDVTARDFQRADGVFSRAKGFDSFCPVGPWIETDLDPGNLAVRCWVDGELRQDGRTSDLIFGLKELLAFISSVMTLEPGDLISTGTPSGVGPLHAGQHVVVEVEGIGQLENPVVDREDREHVRTA